MKKTRILILFVWALVFLALAQSCAKKEISEITLPQGKTAEIIFLVGDVFVSSGEDDWVKAQVGDILKEGSRIKTEGNSYCEIVLSSGTVFRMKDRSMLQLVQLPESQRDNKSLIKLEAGDLFAKVKRIIYRSEDRIATSSVTLAVRGTEFLVRTGGLQTGGIHAGGDQTGGVQDGNAPAGQVPGEQSSAEPSAVGQSSVEQGSVGQGSTEDPQMKGVTEVLVAGGVVNLRLNVDTASLRAVPRELKPVLLRIERGMKVKAGYKLSVSDEKVEAIRSSIQEAAGKPKLEVSQAEALKQEVALRPIKLAPEDRERLKELEEMTIWFRRGDAYYISPNFDGVNDEFVLDMTRFDLGRMRAWKMVILDGRAQIQKEIAGNGAAPVRLPEKITWNMVNKSGQLAPDGNYVYELFTIERGKRERLRVRGILVVDTRPPDLEINPQDMTFSPNGDGVKDIIAFTIQAESDIEWSCVITAMDGIVVKTFEWGKEIPVVFEWDGIGENGNVLPDGLYDLTITGTDRAGNKTVKVIKEIALDTRSRGATVVVDQTVFSPNGDGVLDTVTFFPFLTDPNRIDTWDLVLQTEKGETACRFRGLGVPPLRIVWDGSPEKGRGFEYLPKVLPSGKYFYFLKAVYRSGVNTFSYKKELILDNDPPRVAVGVSPELFSPDGDGENDTLFIVPTITDLTPITNWKAVVYTARGTVFKTFAGLSQPKEAITWDGVSDSGIRVSSAEDYTVQFDATDMGSNTVTSDKAPFSIDILVIPTERGLKIQVSNIEFAFNTAELKGEKTFAVLKRVVEVLKKYRKYAVTIEGHTDITGDPVYNVDLSKKRAEAVGKFLIQNGIEQDRLSYTGYGSQYPIDTNATVEGRARNRRVEFLLQKQR